MIVPCAASVGENCTHGEVSVSIRQCNFIAGWISICLNGEWRAVCDSAWGIEEARVLCSELGFTVEGTATVHFHVMRAIPKHIIIATGSQFCRNSCFGESEVKRGVIVDCNGNETRLSQCRHGRLGNSPCANTTRHAGVHCCRLK